MQTDERTQQLTAAEKPPWYRNVRVLRIIVQVVIVGGVVAIAAFFIGNMITNMQRQGISLGFDYLSQPAEFTIGEDEEVSAATGGIEETEFGQPVVKLLQSRGAPRRAVRLDALELGAEFVEEQGADEFEDVLFRRVVCADLPAFLAVHDGLEERAEYGR